MPELVTGVCCPVAGNVNSDQQRETRIPPEVFGWNVARLAPWFGLPVSDCKGINFF